MRMLVLLSAWALALAAQAIEADRLVLDARQQVGVTLSYDPAYRQLSYPGGDVPTATGVCTDVVIRALRQQGLDLQEAVHRDMRGNFAVYRPDGARDRYLLASGDNGKAFLVQPQGSGRARYHSVNFLTAHQATIMPAQNRLPSPQRVLDMAEAKRMVTAIPTWPVQPAPVQP